MIQMQMGYQNRIMNRKNEDVKISILVLKRWNMGNRILGKYSYQEGGSIYISINENMKYNTYTSTSVPFHSAVQTYIQVCDPLSMRYFF